MFIINAFFGMVSIGIVLAVYAFLTRRKLDTIKGDTRSGIFNAVAEWSARVVNKLPEAKERSWQPNLLMPVESEKDVLRAHRLIYSLVNPKGSLKILGFSPAIHSLKGERTGKRLQELADHFMDQGISARSALIQSPSFEKSAKTSMQSLKAAFFRPNILFISLSEDRKNDEVAANLLREGRNFGMGGMLFIPYEKLGLGLEKSINMWVYFNNLNSLQNHKVGHVNLAILCSYIFQRNWEAQWNIITVLNPDEGISIEEEKERAEKYMKRLQVLARIPENCDFSFTSGEHFTVLDKKVPQADLNIFSMRGEEVDVSRIRERVESIETSCLFLLDSGQENALV